MDALDVAEMLKVSRESVYRLVESEGLPCARLGNGRRGALRFDRAAVEAWFHQRAELGTAS